MAARDLVALETQHVYDVYDQIATHFSDITHRAWPRVRQFIKDLPPGSLVADVGCGNGRYLRINKRVLKLGSDRCQGLVDIAGQRGHEVMAADNLHLPYRDGIFDAVISVAVIHHFASWERRVSGLRELARITRPGGRLLICVWAFEQKHRRFDGQDVLVPWTKPVKTFRQRGGSKTSLGTSSEFSSTSSISEDEVNQEQKAVAPERGNSTDLDKGTDCPVPSTKSVHCIENGEGTVLSTISGRDVCLVNGNKNLSDEDADFECLPATLKSHQTKAIRPTSLCLKYRHTAHNAYSAYKAHMANKARSLLSPGQRQSASGYQGQQRGRRVQSSSGNCTCSSVRGLTSQARLTAVKQSSSVQKASRRSGESALPSSQHTCITQQFSRKKEVSPVLTDVSQPESLGQPETSQRSVLLKLKSLLSRRTSHESDHGVARNRGLAKLGWWDHYKKCVMELERDLSSFRAFCSFVKADKDYSVLSGEFIVREFPMSSKPRDFTMSCKPRADVNPVPRPSAGEIETSSSRSNPTDTNHLPLYPNQLPSVKNGLPMDTNHLSSVEYMPADTIELPSEENSSHVDTVELPSEESVQRSCGEVETAERSVSQCRRSHGCLLNKTHCGCVSYEVEGKNPTHSSDLSRAKPVKSQPSRNEVVKHSDVSSSHAKEKAAPQDTLSCPKRQGGPSPCVTNNVETNGDNVFEDFASSMSACLSNLSGRDLTVEAAGKAVSCQRYYHVFKEGELEDLIRTYVPELRIVQSYFDHANWCLIAEKI